MLLNKIEIVFAEGFGLQASVDITFKRQNCRRAFSGVKFGCQS